MHQSKYQTVLWDFDGVWSHDFFYKSFIKTDPSIWNFIQDKIFGVNNEGRPDKWMRAEMSIFDINRFISKETGIDLEYLNKKSLEDAFNMEVEMGHVPIVNALKRKGITVGMVTDNMDLLNIVNVPRLGLDKIFGCNLFNSFYFKRRKSDGLFDIAMKSMHANYATTLLIDDSEKARLVFENKGGNTYKYIDFRSFKSWAVDNLL